MSEFSIETTAISLEADKIMTIGNETEKAYQTLISCEKAIAKCMSDFNAGISNSLQSTAQSLTIQIDRIKRLSESLENIAQQYSKAEATIHNYGVPDQVKNETVLWNTSEFWFDRIKGLIKIISKITNNKNNTLSADVGLYGTIFAYCTGLYTLFTSEYQDGIDKTAGILGLFSTSGNAWSGLYKYFEKTLDPRNAAKFGNAFQTKAGVVSLLAEVCGFVKEGTATLKTFRDENAENYEKLNQMLKNTISGLDVGKAYAELKYGTKSLIKTVEGKFAFATSEAGAKAMANAGAVVTLAKAGIHSFIDGNTQYHMSKQDCMIDFNEMGDVLLKVGVSGLTSIVDSGTFDILALNEQTENIANVIKMPLERIAEMAYNSPCTRTYWEFTRPIHEFVNNPDNPEWQRWTGAVIESVGTFDAMLKDAALAPFRGLWVSTKNIKNYLNSR